MFFKFVLLVYLILLPNKSYFYFLDPNSLIVKQMLQLQNYKQEMVYSSCK